MKNAINFIKSFAFGTLVSAIICTALGIALLVARQTASKVVCMTFGVILIINALVQLVLCFKDNAFAQGRTLLMFSSLIMSVIGVWMLSGPETVSSALIYVILSVILLYHGLMDMKFSMYLKSSTHNLWYVALLIGFITIGIGILSLVFYKESWLAIAVGIGMLFDGLSDMWVVWIMAAAKRGSSRMTDTIESEATDVTEISK